MPTRFRDVYMPPEIPGYPCMSAPRTSTRIVQVESGAEQANQVWDNALRKFTLPEAIRDPHAIIEALKDQWLVMSGPAFTWPFKDPLDFASAPLLDANVAPAITMFDQLLGTGNAAQVAFPLRKTYVRGAYSKMRPIHLPRVATVLVSVNGADPGGWTVSRPGGVVTFGSPPANGHLVKAGFLFDCEVRFENDQAFEGIVKSYHVSGCSDLTLFEMRPC